MNESTAAILLLSSTSKTTATLLTPAPRGARDEARTKHGLKVSSTLNGSPQELTDARSEQVRWAHLIGHSVDKKSSRERKRNTVYLPLLPRDRRRMEHEVLEGVLVLGDTM